MGPKDGSRETKLKAIAVLWVRGDNGVHLGGYGGGGEKW